MSWESILKYSKESGLIETVKRLNTVGKKSGWARNITFVDLIVLSNIMANELKREESSELRDIMMKFDTAMNDVEDMLIETQKYFEENEIDGTYWQRKQRDD